MRHRLVKAIDNTHGNNRPQKFLSPIIIHRGTHLAVGGACLGTPAHFATGVQQVADNRCQMAGRARLVDQKRLCRAANAGASHFCIGDNIARHVEGGITMHIDMTNTLQMGKNRHPRFFLHAPNQIFAAAWHNNVNIAVQPAQHHANGGAVGAGDKLHAVRVKPCRLQPAGKTGMNGLRRLHNLGTAAQNHRISGF